MRYLRIKKFFLDYLIGSGLIVLLLVALVGNLTILDTNGILTLGKSCSSSQSSQEILRSAKLVLRADEQCKFVQPCKQLLELQCEGTAKVSDIPMQFFAQDLLVLRVKGQLEDEYGFAGYSDKSTFRIPIDLFMFFFLYLAIAVEAGALLFALWRQKSLRQTFSLSHGSKTDQILKPLIIGIFLAAAVLVLNYQVGRFFEYPNEQQARVKLAYFQTVAGVILAVLIAPLVEELVFRGVLLRFFIERKRQLLGLLVASALFAVLHVLSEDGLGWQLYKFSVYFIVSAVLCWFYIKQKNLWSPIILHGSYNATMVGFLNLFV